MVPNGFQTFMGQVISQIYIEDIRCITVHPIPPFTVRNWGLQFRISHVLFSEKSFIANPNSLIAKGGLQLRTWGLQLRGFGCDQGLWIVDFTSVTGHTFIFRLFDFDSLHSVHSVELSVETCWDVSQGKVLGLFQYLGISNGGRHHWSKAFPNHTCAAYMLRQDWPAIGGIWWTVI